MRDYADLIKTLRRYGAWEQHSKDAADAIEELLARDVVPTDFHERCLQLEIRKRIELEKQMPHWISVEERLSDYGERVLIMFKPLDEEECISIGWLTQYGFECYDDSVYFFRSVTHWMPLPEPPKEETE